MNKPFKIFFLLFTLFCCEAESQTNLVPNGSFEVFDTCPQFPNQLHFAKGWYRPTIASSDYFNACDVMGYMSTPNNFYGNILPFQGEAYAGFALSTNFDYSEYIACKLSSPLEQDLIYTVTIYVALSGYSDYATNSIGIHFDADSIYDNDPNGYTLINYSPQIITGSYITDTLNWTKIYGLYRATGGERFIAIGNFKPFFLTDTVRSFGTIGYGTYYFVDSVSVYSNDVVDVIPNVFTPNNDGSNDVWKCNFNVAVDCLIYNRWGKLIFQSNKQIIQWDGRTKAGMECTDGIYYYTIEKKETKYKGFIQLIR